MEFPSETYDHEFDPPLPEHLAPLVDTLVAASFVGHHIPPACEPLLTWLEDQGWINVVSNSGGVYEYSLVVLGELADDLFNDDQLSASTGVPVTRITDADRTAFGRDAIADSDTSHGPALFQCPFVDATGRRAVLLASAISTPAGWFPSWIGVFRSLREGFTALPALGIVIQGVTKVSDEMVLSRWLHS